MNTQQGRPHFDLGPEDAARIARLSEEIQGRLAELALVFGRVTGEQATVGAITGYSPAEAGHSQADSPDNTMEIFEFLGIDGCYGSIGGVPFFEWPCGKGG